ncbi:iron complex transport system substrate-binding protein [Roseateles sp. YR242]|uniref:ABC transporter substrate-binding protein n=1 Tax=Roseateles sp. YR242 TaxID=1855305 RepID=UPI0008D59FCE|nr:helical backbone metal receptor [Roseateles sp. YR242]SEL70623.1 iron complex transport system substrate-binding protein [Roseateles sp. YR242]
MTSADTTAFSSAGSISSAGLPTRMGASASGTRPDGLRIAQRLRPCLQRLHRCLRALPAAVLAAVALQATAAPLSLKDDRGATIQLPDTPRRIVSLLPSLTETICELGDCDKLVGVDRFSNYPARTQGLPKLGGLDDTAIEMLVALKPDVVLLGVSARVIDRLESLGLKVVALEPKSMTDVQRVLGKVGLILGKPDDARRLWNRIDGHLSQSAASLPPAARGLSVYYEVDAGPYGAGSSSFIGEILTRLGAHNILPPELGPFPKLNPEFIVRADPQVIMVGQRNAPGLPQRPGWAGIRAVKQQRVCVWLPAESDVLVRPGPRMSEAAALMARCLRDAAAGPVAWPTTPFNAPPGGMR